MPESSLFLALMVPLGIRPYLKEACSCFHLDSISKWKRPESYHITVKFLGDVPQERVNDLCKRLRVVASQVKPFNVSVCGLGAFPSPEKPRVLWVGVDQDTRNNLVMLHAEIEDTLSDGGYRRDDYVYTPHITLGVTDGSVGVIEAVLDHRDWHVQAPPIGLSSSGSYWYADGLSLIRSTDHMPYTEVERFPFLPEASGSG